MAPHLCGCCPAPVGVVLVGLCCAPDLLHITFYIAQLTVLFNSLSTCRTSCPCHLPR